MADKFKPHKMYSKSGIIEFVTTMKKHLSLKKKWEHYTLSYC
jgi:hypothetical protein